METDKKQLLRNPDIQPTSDVIAEALGDANDAYAKFIKELEKHDIQLEWRYYIDGKAWLAKGIHRWSGVRGGQKTTTVLWLSIWDSFFNVTIYFPEKFRKDVQNLPTDETVKAMVENSKQMGKMNYFPLVFNLYSDEVFESIFSLADFRKRIK